MFSKAIAVPVAHEPAEELRTPPLRSGFAALMMRWFLAHHTIQPPGTAPVLPDDARKQLQHDRLLAQRRLERLSMTVRPPL